MRIKKEPNIFKYILSLVIAISFILIIYINHNRNSTSQDLSTQKLKAELKQDFNEYLSSSTSQLNIGGFPNGLVTFINDDCDLSVWNKIKPIFEENNVPACVAVTTNKLERNDYLSVDNLTYLQDEGWEIISGTVNHYHLNEHESSEVESELRDSKETLTKLGFQCNNVVYPFGNVNDKIIQLTKKYYSCGLTLDTGVNNVNRIPLNYYNLCRVTLGGTKYTIGTEYDTFDYYKNCIDYAKETSSWLIFMIHSSDSEDYQIEDISKVVKYCTETDIPVVTVNEALSKTNELPQ